MHSFRPAMGAGNSTPDMPRTPNRALVVLPIKPTASSSLAVEAPTTLPQQVRPRAGRRARAHREAARVSRLRASGRGRATARSWPVG